MLTAIAITPIWDGENRIEPGEEFEMEEAAILSLASVGACHVKGFPVPVIQDELDATN